MGHDYLKIYLEEKKDAACAAPFATSKGKVEAPALVAKLPKIFGKGGSWFRRKDYDVDPDNFAKVRCYMKDSVSDPRNGAVHCEGINIFGDLVASEKEKDKTAKDGFLTISKTDRKDIATVSVNLAKTCTAVLTKERGFDSVLGKDEW